MADSRMKVTEDLVNGEKIVRVRMSCRNPVAFFLLLWWSFWTFGVVTALKKAVSDPSIIVWLLIALPADVVVFWLMMLRFFGKRVITLGGGKGSVFTGFGPFGFRKRFGCGYGYDVRIVDSASLVNGRRLKEIRITRRDDPESATRVCAFWPDGMKPYLAALLSRG